MARPQYNIIFMRRFHCQLNSALRQPSPAPPANRLVHTSNNAGDWPTKAVSNNTMHEQYVEPSRKFADIIVLEGGRNLVALEMIMQRIRAHIDTP